jgi:hypothetical protein
MNSVFFSPQTNYTDRVTAAGRRIIVPTLRIEGCRVVSPAIPHSR